MTKKITKPKPATPWTIYVFANGRVALNASNKPEPTGAIKCFEADSRVAAELLIVGTCSLGRDNPHYWAPGIGPFGAWRVHDENDLRYFQERLRVDNHRRTFVPPKLVTAYQTLKLAEEALLSADIALRLPAQRSVKDQRAVDKILSAVRHAHEFSKRLLVEAAANV